MRSPDDVLPGSFGSLDLTGFDGPIPQVVSASELSETSEGQALPKPLSGLLSTSLASVSSLKSSWKATKEAVQARKEGTLEATRGLVQEAMPQKIREWSQKSKTLMHDVKEQYQEKRQEIVQKVVTGLEVSDEAKAAHKTSESRCPEQTQRWWAAACSAAHHPHSLANDPPALPTDRTLIDPVAKESVGTPAGLQEALACLEVELLNLSDDPPLTRHDGAVAVSPVCQLALGGRCTGALRPRFGAYAGAGRPSKEQSTEEIASDGGASSIAGGSKDEPEEVGGASSARFAVEEVLGCDLRVHIFDSGSKKFCTGIMEDHSFCGGAFVPLSSMLSRHTGPSGRLGGLLSNTIEADVMVKLLPLEALRMTTKLQKAETSGLERPPTKRNLGRALFHVRLTFCENLPACAYLATPYRGWALDAPVDTGTVDKPVSILKAAAKALERLHRALDARFVLDAAERLRERAVTSALFVFIWTYMLLRAPQWQVPGCVAAALLMLALEIFHGSAELADPPRLFKDELSSEGGLTRIERTKKSVTNAVMMEIRMMRLAELLTRVAVVAEKVRFILTWKDPRLSLVCAVALCSALTLATALLRVSSAVLSCGLPVVAAWAAGCFVSLPANGRDCVRELITWLQHEKTRILGRGRMGVLLARCAHMLLALWCRIPDSLEAQHLDLCEGYVLESRDSKVLETDT